MLFTCYVTWTTVHRCMNPLGPKYVHLRQVVGECKYNTIYLQKLSPYILLWAEDCFSVRCTWTSLYLGYKTHTGNHETLLFSPVNDSAISLKTIIMGTMGLSYFLLWQCNLIKYHYNGNQGTLLFSPVNDSAISLKTIIMGTMGLCYSLL